MLQNGDGFVGGRRREVEARAWGEALSYGHEVIGRQTCGRRMRAVEIMKKEAGHEWRFVKGMHHGF
jgi:hypothetical protein